MKHFLSESAVWESASEFVTPDGVVSHGYGESAITVNGNGIVNESWVLIGDFKRVNNYKIIRISEFVFTFESLNPELGIQTGSYHVDRNMLFSKFFIRGTSLNGFEIIRREDSVCYAHGALYEDDLLMNTWSARMVRK